MERVYRVKFTKTHFLVSLHAGNEKKKKKIIKNAVCLPRRVYFSTVIQYCTVLLLYTACSQMKKKKKPNLSLCSRERLYVFAQSEAAARDMYTQEQADLLSLALLSQLG